MHTNFLLTPEVAACAALAPFSPTTQFPPLRTNDTPADP